MDSTEQIPPEQRDLKEMLREHDLLSLFTHQSFRQTIRRVAHGIRQPKETGEYKYAKLQIIRLSAPLAGVVGPVILIALMGALVKMDILPERQVEVQIVDPTAVEKLEEIEELKNEPLELPEPIDVDFTTDTPVDTLTPPTQAQDFSPKPAAFDSVAMVKSPVIMKGIIGSRTGAARGAAMKAYGGGIAGGITEGAVLRALRWLKKYQEPDGSWTQGSGGQGGGTQPKGAAFAMTSLALLTYLAHGETPASDEFGPTVEKAIQWLVKSQNANGRLGGSYEHQISTYAMCEAYALTKIPMLKDAAQKALDIVITGQNSAGSWNYPLLATDKRSDTSVAAWCAQALKAGKMAGLENAGLEECIKKAIEGFKGQADPAGGFCYATTIPSEGPPRASNLTGAGTLSMQFLGASKAKETRAGIKYLQEKRVEFDWKSAKWNDIYWWYYDTQARFHEGGDVWEKWNKIFALELVKNQTVVKGAGADGKDIGYWTCDEVAGAAQSSNAHGLVLNTTLCALQLQVYYRYLPTYKPATDGGEEATQGNEDEIEVEVTI